MKNIKKLFALMLLPIIGLASCNEDVSQPPINNPGIHSGQWNDPMSCYQVGLGTSVEGYEAVWVTGYIVGCVNVDISGTCSEQSADFNAPGPVQTNILMADNPDEKDWTKCISVQLPSGAVRTALNITNASNKGKEVTILGSLEKYCGIHGVKSVSAYVWGNEGDKSIDIFSKPVVPEEPGAEGSVIYSALAPTLTEMPTDWTIDNVSLASGLNYVWSWKEYSGSHYLNASAYANSKANEAVAYCYSPVVSLAGYSNITIEFEHAAKFQTTIKELCKVVIRQEGASEWTELEIPVWPGTTSWAFVNSGVIDANAFADKNVQVGFKYASNSNGADTWEIKNLVVKGTK